MTTSKDYHDIREQHLTQAEELEDQSRRVLRRLYPISAKKRDPRYPPAEGWQTLASMADASHTMIGRLQRQIAQQQSITTVVGQHVVLPKGARFQAVINSRGELIVTVATASIAHQLRYDLPAAKSALEKVLVRVIPATKIQIDPSL